MENKIHHKFFGDNKFYYLTLAAALVIFALLLFWPHTARSGDSFGSCLKEKGVSMYGSDRCEFCLNQKHILGDDFLDINYINCDVYSDLCETRGIRSYPVWSLNDKKFLKGVQSIPALAELSGCEYKK